MQNLFKEDIPANTPVKGNVIISFQEDEMCDKLRRHLQSDGYGVYICKSFEEFMEIEHVDVKCIVIDVTEGRPTTFHAIEIIRQSPVGSKIPILVVADVASTSNVVRALNAGASDYMLQPFTRRDILQGVSRLALGFRG